MHDTNACLLRLSECGGTRYADGRGLLTQIAHSSKTFQGEASSHPARASFHTDRYITMHVCMQHHTRCTVLLSLLPWHRRLYCTRQHA
jgi:hypothetical protein